MRHPVTTMSERQVDVLILGTLLVRHGDRTAVPSAATTRAIIAVLALVGDPGLSVRLLGASAWPEGRADVSSSTVSVGVHRARRWLADQVGPGIRIDRTTSGYALRGATVDAHRFVRLAADERTLAEAMALWRGEPLADVPVRPEIAAPVQALQRGRLDTAAGAARQLLARGRPDESVAMLTPLAQAHPLNETLQAALIEALAATGQQAEALDRYERLRSALADELGVQPGRDLSATLGRVLRQEIPVPERPVPAVADVVPAQLPPDVGGFTGRAAQLGELDALVRVATEESVVISVVTGAGGVGKTALAVRWAHLAVDRFPDGQLYVDLRGYASERPVRPADALGRFLRALGVPAGHVPPDESEAAALYRTTMAGRRVLVLVDNAATAEQVRPLVPGTPGSLVLVTSRDKLDGLVARDGAQRLELEVFRPEESTALLVTLLGAERTRAERVAAAELADVCGHLALALRIAAARLADQPDLSIEAHVRALRADRLTQLAINGDPKSSIRAVFDMSYARLPDADRRLFRLLGVAPGADISALAATALADGDHADVCQTLSRLATAHLIRRDGARYSCHDLVRDYARALAERDDPRRDRQAALRRLGEWTFGVTDAAARTLWPHNTRLPRRTTPIADGITFATAESASTWLDIEIANVAALVALMAPDGTNQVAARIIDTLRPMFSERPNHTLWTDSIATTLATARSTQDWYGVAATATVLGNISRRSVGPAESMPLHREAVAAARRAGWLDGDMNGSNGLAVSMFRIGRPARSAAIQRRLIGLAESHGLRYVRTAAMGNLGLTYETLGRLAESVRCYLEALAGYRELACEPEVANVLANLGFAYLQLGRMPEAREALTTARAQAQRPTWMERDPLLGIARLDLALGRFDEARECVVAAMATAVQDNVRHQQSRLSGILGDIARCSHQWAGALEWHRQALRQGRDSGDPTTEPEAMVGLAGAYQDLGQLARATGCARRALALASRGRFCLIETDALTTLAGIELAQGDVERAAAHAGRAAEISDHCGARPRHAAAVTVLSRIRQAQSRCAPAAVKD
jgi:DNA-binding SARP family transcriptional activator